MDLSPYRLDGLELATAIVYGRDPDYDPLPVDGDQPKPREVLEAILMRALLSPPCVVGFSGGRDSSAILALAVHVARRHDLPMPLPVTNVIPGDAASAEDEWQEAVIRHLDLADWERVHISDQMDVVGPYATTFLKRFGPYFPFNGHFVVPGMTLARGGTYVTGVGGDELFELGETDRLAMTLTGRMRPTRYDLANVVHMLQPLSRRIRWLASTIPEEPWLQPEIRKAFRHDLAAAMAKQRIWYSTQLREDVWPDRGRIAVDATLRSFASMLGASTVQPFMEPALLSSLCSHKGRTGWSSRAAAMDALFGDVLPPQTRRRSTKATFANVFFNEYSRALTSNWVGDGVNDELVDAAQLRKAWQESEVDGRSLSLVQSIWCQKYLSASSVHG